MLITRTGTQEPCLPVAWQVLLEEEGIKRGAARSGAVNRWHHLQ